MYQRQPLVIVAIFFAANAGLSPELKRKTKQSLLMSVNRGFFFFIYVWFRAEVVEGKSQRRSVLLI